MPLASDSQRATIPTRSGAPPRSRSSNSYRDSALGVFVLLLAFRIVNALTLRTFFQPDEFFQSLEPAWQLAFGPSAGACITWVKPLSDESGTLPIGSFLTMHPGVENAVAVVSASSTVRGSLPAGGKIGCPLWPGAG